VHNKLRLMLLRRKGAGPEALIAKRRRVECGMKKFKSASRLAGRCWVGVDCPGSTGISLTDITVEDPLKIRLGLWGLHFRLSVYRP